MADNQDMTILIVDDVEMNREILALRFNDFNCVLKENGLEALKYIEERKGEGIDCVLLDHVMPEMTGFELLQALREKQLLQDVPIFIITAENDESVILPTFDYGITDVISKPFNAKFLYKRVTSQIELYRTKKSLEYQNLQKQKQLYEKEKEFTQLNLRLIETLAVAIEFRSGETGNHVNNISNLTYKILLKLRNANYKECGQLSDEEIKEISYAAMLHDVGKIAIPDSILNKPGKLTKEEFEIIKTHTTSGYDLLNKIGINSKVIQIATDIAKHHHERWDGRGYPDGLKENEISTFAQVVGIIDVYDALTQERCYKKAFSKEKAIDMIKNNECGVFCPELVTNFCAVIDDI